MVDLHITHKDVAQRLKAQYVYCHNIQLTTIIPPSTEAYSNTIANEKTRRTPATHQSTLKTPNTNSVPLNYSLSNHMDLYICKVSSRSKIKPTEDADSSARSHGSDTSVPTIV